MQNSKVQLKIQKYVVPLVIIGIAVLLRLLPHPANVAPIAAMALFGGVYLDKKYAIALPLLTMVVSDIFLGFSQSTPFVYASFAITGFIGMWLKQRKSVRNIIFASLSSSVLFFLITNFGYWLTYSLYPKTFAGQMQAYYYALPFFRNTVLGDFLYTGLFFGGYEMVMRLFHQFGHGKNLHKNRG